MHSGRNASVRLLPASVDRGFRFHRLDSEGKDGWISATIDRVVRYPACTCIANDEGVSVRTIEHLLAACYALGIDNLEIEISGEEIPILDGSAEPIVRLMESVGLSELDGRRRCIEILEPIHYQDEHRKFCFEPSGGFSVDINIYPKEYGHMQWATAMSAELFRREIVEARAWGRLKDVWMPKILGKFLKRPILRGAGLDTATVYAFGKPINSAGLKHSDDMVRHKVLDIIGDLQLLGADIKGRVICHSSAHVTNHAAMAELLAQPQAWRYV